MKKKMKLRNLIKKYLKENVTFSFLIYTFS